MIFVVATKSSVALAIMPASTDSKLALTKIRLRRSRASTVQSDLIARRLLGAQNDAYS